MAGEYYIANTLEEARKQLREVYKLSSDLFEDITKEDYEKIDKSERIDSDNHYNLERLKKDFTKATDQTFYKYLEDRKIAYHVKYIDKDGNEAHDYFILQPRIA